MPPSLRGAGSRTCELEPQSRLQSISDLFISVSTSDPKRVSREEAVIAISTRPSEQKSRLDRSSILPLLHHSLRHRDNRRSRPKCSAVLGPVRTCGDSWVCTIFDSSAAVKTAERSVSEIKLLLKCRRDGCHTFSGGDSGGGEEGSKHSDIRAPTAQKSEPSGSLQSARAAGVLAVGFAIGVATRPPPLRKPPFLSSSARARERERAEGRMK
jgi:hypothetical protein